MWGKCGERKRKTLAERVLQGFRVPGAGFELSKYSQFFPKGFNL